MVLGAKGAGHRDIKSRKKRQVPQHQEATFACSYVLCTLAHVADTAAPCPRTGKVCTERVAREHIRSIAILHTQLAGLNEPKEE